MKHYAVIGSPIAHSKSPLLHNAAFEWLKIDGFYEAIELLPGEFQYQFNKLIESGYQGFNVTLPHKQTVLPLMHELSDAARQIGAVNTVLVKQNGTLYGHNTDAEGFWQDITSKTTIDLDKGVAILGAGGAARAVLHAVLAAGCQHISVLNRTLTHAQTLVQNTYAQAYELTRENCQKALQHQVIINCTSLGLKTSDEMPWFCDVPFEERHFVYDTIYNPPTTKLMHFAHRCKARSSNGLGMLIHQAALAFSLWTNTPPPVDIMQQVFQPC